MTLIYENDRLILIPNSKPKKLDSVDYLNYVIRAVAIGLLSGIASIMIPLWAFIFLSPHPRRQEELFNKWIRSDTFNAITDFFSNHLWSVTLVAGGVFAVSYLLIMYSNGETGSTFNIDYYHEGKKILSHHIAYGYWIGGIQANAKYFYNDK